MRNGQSRVFFGKLQTQANLSLSVTNKIICALLVKLSLPHKEITLVRLVL